MISKQKDKNRAVHLRKLGYSYSQIQGKVKASKSSLSLWLRNMPLSKERIDHLRGRNPKRIERFRNTMRKKKEAEQAEALIHATKDIGELTKREQIIAGFFLYWGEGTKAAECTVAVTNTDPDALRFFVRWLKLLGVKKNRLRVVLHLYKDMDIDTQMEFWSSYLGIPKSQFRKPYIKNSRFCDITYTSGFGHGTCSVLYSKKDLYLYVMAALKYIRTRA